MSGCILGLWDGHDAGAAIVAGSRVLAAVNEERLTRRKLDVGFPALSVGACLKRAGVQAADIDTVTVSTADVAKTLTRLVPALREEYYRIRRRKQEPGHLTGLKKRAKYLLTEAGPNPLTRRLSALAMRRHLREAGLGGVPVTWFDHHYCHAAAAAFFVPQKACTVITLDGIGDGLSGSVRRFENSTFSLIGALSGRHSIGIFFEHVTNLLNMRELEDEGKVMALANYACPVSDAENPLLRILTIDDVQVRCRYSSLGMYAALKKILWRYPPEQFAGMAQRVLELRVCELVGNCIRRSGLDTIVLSGGVFANIKLNMRIRQLECVKRCVVFPHMGDGGLALGAAFAQNYQHNGITAYDCADLAWGPTSDEDAMRAAVERAGLTCRRVDGIEQEAARLIAGGAIVFWFQGGMEYGPRALGQRSILARPDSVAIKDLLNMRLKLRVWYQPFCPSMLEEDAREVLEEYDGLDNRFMTMAYMVRPEFRPALAGVIGIDGSCRPHIVTPDDRRYERLLREVKMRVGRGIVLNTSFNVHGDPLVCTPDDAVETLLRTGSEYLIMDSLLVHNGAA
jgi:carbamoyltransferase